jgi:hypothetical protein
MELYLRSIICFHGVVRGNFIFSFCIRTGLSRETVTVYVGTYIIQGVSAGIVNVLGDGSMDYSE